ncbi:MAG TPA: cytochrome c oxidase assembly protein [Acidimicrobiia bacterium]|nr:cytochrome c oxidase assembly protein [Acidimicrobiia bacterium]
MAAGESVGLDAFPFHIHPDVVGVVIAIVGFYVFGLTRLAPRHAPRGEAAVTRRQVAWFTAGVALLLAVDTWPIHDIAKGSLYSFHMIQHLVMALIVPAALLKGTPWWLLRLLVKPMLPVLRVITRPIVALLVFNGIFALIHAPVIVEAMLTNELLHFSFHLALLGSALLMWWPVIGPIPDLPKLTPLMSMGYLFLQSLIPTIPASFLTFADEPVYEIYETLPRLWGLSVLDDQLIAGLIMKIGGGVILWTVIAVVFFRWAFEEERAAAAERRVRAPLR